MDWRSVFGTFGFEERWMLMGAFFKGVEMGSLIKIRSLPDVNQGITCMVTGGMSITLR
jgi:hypothetical protein